MAFFKLLNISKKYQNQIVLDDISFSLPRNGLIMIKGKSGCGKSTLLNIIFGIVKPDKGKILINDKNQILMGKRSDNPLTADSEMHEEGSWSLPGGNIEYGETFYEAGRREVKEEADIDVGSLEVFCVQTDMNQFAHYVSVGMLSRDFSGDAKVMEPGEIVAWKWFDKDKIPTNIFSASKKTIECYLSGKFYID